MRFVYAIIFILLWIMTFQALSILRHGFPINLETPPLATVLPSPQPHPQSHTTINEGEDNNNHVKLICVVITFMRSSDPQKTKANNLTMHMYQALPAVLPLLALSSSSPDNAVEAWLLAGNAESSILNQTQCNEHGTPLVSSLFEQAEEKCPASVPFVAYANADILFDTGLTQTLEMVRDWPQSSGIMMVGRRSNVDMAPHFSTSTQQQLRDVFDAQSELFMEWAQDYFITARRLVDWPRLPPYVIGRRAYDNALVDWAFHNAVLVDATATIKAVHQTLADGNFAGQSDIHADKEYNANLPGGAWDHGATSVAPYKTMQTADGGLSIADRNGAVVWVNVLHQLQPELDIWHMVQDDSHPCVSFHQNTSPRLRPDMELEQILGKPVVTPTISNVDLMDWLTDQNKSHGFVVNFGAGDSCLDQNIECDELNAVLVSDTLNRQDIKQTIHAVLFEPHAVAAKQLRKTYSSKYTSVDETFISEPIVVDVFRSKQIPLHFDILKMDIDSNDCSLIHTILSAGYRPSIIQAEYNILFPPPLSYIYNYSGHFSNIRGVKFPQQVNQCSLQYMSDMMSSHGYILLQVLFWDAWYISEDVLISPNKCKVDIQWWWYNGYYLAKYSKEIVSKSAYAAGAITMEKLGMYANNISNLHHLLATAKKYLEGFVWPSGLHPFEVYIK